MFQRASPSCVARATRRLLARLQKAAHAFALQLRACALSVRCSHFGGKLKLGVLFFIACWRRHRLAHRYLLPADRSPRRKALPFTRQAPGLLGSGVDSKQYGKYLRLGAHRGGLSKGVSTWPAGYAEYV